MHALTFWDQVVDAADSLTFRLMFNSLRAAYEPALEALAPVMAEEVGQVGAYRVLTAAIGEGDPDTARAAADRVLRPATAQPARRPRRPQGDDMTKASPEIEKLAAERLAADEAADHRAPGGPTSTLGRVLALVLAAPVAVPDLGRSWSAPIAARVVVGGGSWWELLIPAALIALFPVIEWVIHVVHPALAAAPRRPAYRSTRCSPASTASTTPTRATSRSCSSRGRCCAGCSRRTSWSRCWRCRRCPARCRCWCRSTA